MLEVLVIRAVIRHDDRAELVGQIRVTRASQQRSQKGGLIKVIAAAFEQRQLRALFRAEIVLIADVVMDVIVNALRVVLQSPRQRRNVRGRGGGKIRSCLGRQVE